jgi:uncharacterized protein with HEPN domain
MHVDARKLLWDALRAADRVARFTHDRTFDDYRVVWGIVEADLASLRASLGALLAQP